MATRAVNSGWQRDRFVRRAGHWHRAHNLDRIGDERLDWHVGIADAVDEGGISPILQKSPHKVGEQRLVRANRRIDAAWTVQLILPDRSEEHTSELQSLMRNSYDDFCLKKKKQDTQNST